MKCLHAMFSISVYLGSSILSQFLQYQKIYYLLITLMLSEDAFCTIYASIFNLKILSLCRQYADICMSIRICLLSKLYAKFWLLRFCGPCDFMISESVSDIWLLYIISRLNIKCFSSVCLSVCLSDCELLIHKKVAARQSR